MIGLRGIGGARRIGLAGAAAILLAMAGGDVRAQAPAGAPPVPVTVTTVLRKDVPILLRNIGTVQAFQTVLMRARIDGTLDQLFFEEGQEVKRGDKLALIDPRPYQAALDQALAKKSSDEALLVNARLDLTRSVELARNQYAAQQTVDTRQATVRQLEAQLRSDDAAIAAARVNMDYTVITAPFDGRAGLRQLDPGNVVRAADPAGVGIVTISQIRPIAVLFNLPQDTLPVIQAGVTKAADAAGGKLVVLAYSADDRTLLGSGEMVTVDNAMDTGTGTIKVKARFNNDQNRLWPGQFVNVRLQSDVQKGVLTIPSIAVMRGPANLFVYLAKPDNTVAVTPVKIGQDDGQSVIVTSGLEDGAMVVVNGQSRLQNGSRIVPSPAKPGS